MNTPHPHKHEPPASPRAALFHNRYRDQAHHYLNRCRRIQRALADGALIQLDWVGPVLDREGWRREFRSLLDRRINRKAGGPPHWRKLSPVYQTGLLRDQHRLRQRMGRHIAERWFETPELNTRFAQLLPEREAEE